MSRLTLTDVTLRDGIQMESQSLSLDLKLALFSLLKNCGYSRIEFTSFSHPKWMPQFADSEALCEKLFSQKEKLPELMAFVPNLKGLNRAVAYPIPWFNFFIAATETFNQKNINEARNATLLNLKNLIEETKKHQRKSRVYVSTVFGCPYEGELANKDLFSLLEKVSQLGADEVCLSDTIGVATPSRTRLILNQFFKSFPKEKTALHVHQTYGLGLLNVQAAYDLGVNSFDGTTGGLGGCPYAKGATGNLNIESIAYLFYREKEFSFQWPEIRKALDFIAGQGFLVRSPLWEIYKKGGEIYGAR